MERIERTIDGERDCLEERFGGFAREVGGGEEVRSEEDNVVDSMHSLLCLQSILAHTGGMRVRTFKAATVLAI